MVNEVLRRIRLEEFLRDALPKEDGRIKLSPANAYTSVLLILQHPRRAPMIFPESGFTS